MTGFMTKVSSTMSSRATPAASAASRARSFSASRTVRVISAAPPGVIMAWLTRLIRSSPNRICGFIRPVDAATAPVRRSHRCAAMVVEPRSTASPYTGAVRSPGHRPMICAGPPR